MSDKNEEGPRVFVGPRVNAWELKPPYRPPLKLVQDDQIVDGVDCSRSFTEGRNNG